MAPTVVLVTGGNRGLGRGLVRKFLSLPNHTVIAANRDPSHPTSQGLVDLPKGDSSKLIVVQYDAGVEGAAFDAVKQIQQQGVAHLDVVIPNAGIHKLFPLVKDAQRSDLLEHYQVNVLGPVELYQATRELLQKSPGNPIFAFMGSACGALGRQYPIPNALYGPTKAAITWYGVKIDIEDEWLTTFTLDPDWTQTDMGNRSAEHHGHAFGYAEAPITEEESVSGMVNVLTQATKETYGGKVVRYSGDIQIF